MRYRTHIICIMLMICIFSKSKAQDTLSNIINELQHTSTANHHGHIAFKKIYSRIDYTNTNFSGEMSNLHRFNAEISYTFDQMSVGLLYNNDSKTNTNFQRFSGITSFRIAEKKLTWICSGGFHFIYRYFQYKKFFPLSREPLANDLKNKKIYYNISLSNLFLFKKLFFSTTLGIEGDIYNLLGYHLKISNIKISPSIQYKTSLKFYQYSPRYYFNFKKSLSVNLTGQYKKYIVGLGIFTHPQFIPFDFQYMIGAGYYFSKNFYVNLNSMIYINSLISEKNYVQNFKLSFLYFR